MLDYKGLMADLYLHQHLENQAPMAKYMRNQFQFLGIQSVDRRKIERPYFKAAKKVIRDQVKRRTDDQSVMDWPALNQLWSKKEREFQLVATDFIAETKQYLVPADLPYLKQLIVSKSWWDSVDALVKSIGRLVTNYPALKTDMVGWSQEDNIWVCRAAILHQLGLKDQTDKVLLAKIIQNNLDSDEFFINKAIGWALREYGKTNPEWVADYLQVHQSDLAPLSYREAGKYLH